MTFVDAWKPGWPIIRLSHVLAKGCVAAWPLRNAGFVPPWPDLSGFQNDMQQVTGTLPSWVVGPAGPAIQFKALATQQLKANHSTSMNVGAVGQSYTLAVLFSGLTLAAGPQIIQKLDAALGDYPFNLQVAPSGLANFSIKAGAAAPNPFGGVVNDGCLHRVVGVRDAVNDVVSLYVDGALVSSVADTTAASCENTGNVYFACGRSGLGPYADMDIIEARLLIGAWTPGMVAQDWLDPFAIYRPPAVAEYAPPRAATGGRSKFFFGAA